MKKWLCALLVLAFPFDSRAQGRFPGLPVDSASGKVSYSAVVPVRGTAAANLYQRARSWAALPVAGGHLAVAMDAPPDGRLILRGYVRGAAGAAAPEIWRTIIVDVQEGRYQYQVSEFALVVPRMALVRQGPVEPMLRAAAPLAGATPGQRYRYLQRAVTDTTLPQIAALQQAMATPSKAF